MILSFLRTVFFYILLLAVIRLMGKRQIGQMAPAEFVVTMLCANLASIPIQDGGIPLLSGLVPILTVLGLELVLAGLSMGSLPMRRLLCGSPIVLVERGKILQKNLRLTRITPEELLGLLREKSVCRIGDVQFGILETDGQLSVFLYPQAQPPSARDLGMSPALRALSLLIVSDGRILEENLRRIQKDRAWLYAFLETRSCTLSEVWLLTADQNGPDDFYLKER